MQAIHNQGSEWLYMANVVSKSKDTILERTHRVRPDNFFQNPIKTKNFLPLSPQNTLNIAP